MSDTTMASNYDNEDSSCTQDMVNNPRHYTKHPSGVECVDIARHYDFLLGNVIKYIWRAGHKHEDTYLQDLEKAQWYLNKKIESIKDSQTK